MGSYIIDSIEKIKRRKGWYVCRFDNAQPVELNKEIILKQSLCRDLSLTENQYISLCKQADAAFSREQALKLISFRARSEKELKQRLQLKGVKPSVVSTTVTELKRMNLVDDQDFARRFVNDQIRRRPSGEFLLKSELRQKGVKNSVIESVLKDIFTGQKQVELARKCVDFWHKRHSKVPEIERARKLTKFLYQRGFTWSIIEEVLGDSSAFEGS